MKYMPELFSLLFFVVAIAYIFWGIHIIKLNSKSSLNRIFLLACISLSIWSFAFGMANTQEYEGMALFWRRISAIGWASIHSLMLHFLLLLTNEDASEKQKRLFPLVHIPAFISMYIFAFSNSMAMIQYDLVKINFGWVNRPVNNFWDFFFYLYYVTYIISSLIITWKWKKKLTDQDVRREANLFFLAIIASLFLGSVTDVIWGSVFTEPLPQISPVFILLPTWAMYYLARYHGVMEREKPVKDEIIVTNEDQEKIFKNLSVVFYLAGIFAFVSEYMSFIDKEDALSSALLKALTLVAIGLAIRFIQRIKNNFLRENLTIGVLLLSIPLILLQFASHSGVTVWVYPVCIMICSLVFTKKTLLISTTLVSIITQRLIWILSPGEMIAVDEYDYILRIAMFLAIFAICLYINRIYLAKIRENQYQINFQKVNSEISFEFMTVNQENFDEKVNKMISDIGLFFKVDRVYIVSMNMEKEHIEYVHEWFENGKITQEESIKNISIGLYPWSVEKLKEKGILYIEDIDKIPAEAREEHIQLTKRNVKTLVLVPVESNNEVESFIGIESVLSVKKWSKKEIDSLHILANLLANGLTKVKAEREIEFIAYHDDLTKLPNRYLFDQRVGQAINLAKNRSSLVSVMFIDIDSFKLVNDIIGHSGGDDLLREIGKRLRASLRSTDVVARFGGDEFMIMLDNINDYSHVEKIADNIMKVFEESFIIKDEEFFLTGSGGLATYPVDGQDAETLNKYANISMYEAKSKGKNQYVLCTDKIKNKVTRDMVLSNDLFRAIERNELLVYYQPQIDLMTGKIVGVEALLRWKHPEFGMVSPGIFIPLAEKNNMINDIGRWVLRQSCIQNKKWQDMGLDPLTVAVNVSAIQFINSNILYDVKNALEETKLEAKYLELEVTESIAIKKGTNALEILNKLKEIGVSISIDDFGTEYSSLNRINELSIDRIKIDMQFIQGIEKSEKDRAIILIIINMAKSLGFNVLAEGVETLDQLEYLSEKMCDYVQGYYYYKPMPAEEMEKELKSLEKTHTRNEGKIYKIY